MSKWWFRKESENDKLREENRLLRKAIEQRRTITLTYRGVDARGAAMMRSQLSVEGEGPFNALRDGGQPQMVYLKFGDSLALTHNADLSGIEQV